MFLLHDLVAAIEDRLRLPAINLPTNLTAPSSTVEDIESIAADARRHLGIPAGPLEHVVRTLERHGAVVVRLSMEIDKVDTFSVIFDDRPLVVLTTDKLNRVRSRFDAAHEFGHLIMHRDVIGWERVAERQAHWFAAALLMPAREIRGAPPRLARLRPGSFLDLKAEWKVSIEDVLTTSKDAGRHDRPHLHRPAMKVMSNARLAAAGSPATMRSDPRSHPYCLRPPSPSLSGWGSPSKI